MGCSSSAAAQQRVRNLHKSVSNPQFSRHTSFDIVNTSTQIFTPRGKLKKELNALLDGISSIPVPSNITPIVTLSEDAFPLYLMDFDFDTAEKVTINLPFAAFTHTDKGKYLVIGSADFLQHKMILKTEISAFVENLGIWGTDFKIKTIRVLIYGFSSGFSTSLASDLEAFGYTVDHNLSEFPEKLLYDFIYVPSSLFDPVILSKLEEYAKKGCLCVFVLDKAVNNSPNIYGINALINKVGIGIPMCTLKPSGSSASSHKYEDLEERSYIYLCNQFRELLSSSKPNIEAIDESVVTLRFHVSCLSPSQGELTAALAKDCWDFLIKNGYDKDNIYCADLTLSVIAVLLIDILPHIPPHLVQPAPPATYFPGLCGDVTYENRKIRMKISHKTMLSTDLYLPPGVIGRIHSSSPIIIQIGSHDAVLLNRTGSWKRWPAISTTIEVGEEPVEIASPFGGIVYIGASENKNISIHFHNFCKFPRYSVREDSWYDTMDIPVPWGEIQLKAITLTLPTNMMLLFKDKMKDNFEMIEQLLTIAHNFIGVREGACRRVIFDIDLENNQPLVGELVLFSIDELPQAIDAFNYTPSFLKLLSLIVMAAIPEGMLDDDATMSLATVAVCAAIKELYPFNLPENLNLCESGNPELFTEMWEVAQDTPRQFSEATMRFLSQKLSPDMPMVDRWNMFMDMLNQGSTNSHGPFTLKNVPSLVRLSDRFKMTSFLSTSSSDLLQEFQVFGVTSEN